MKKTVLFSAAALAASLLMSACGSGNAAVVTTEAVTEAAETTTEAVTSTAAEETSAAEKEESTTASETSAETEEESATTPETTAAAGSEAAKETTAAETKAAETAAAEAAKTTGAAPSDIYSRLSSYLPTMVSFDADYISNYYGIDVSELDGYVFAAAEDVTKADTVVILKAKDAGSTGSLATQLATVKQQKEAELQDYNPTAYQTAAAGYVKTAGSYVYLIMSDNAAQIEQVISSEV